MERKIIIKVVLLGVLVFGIFGKAYSQQSLQRSESGICGVVVAYEQGAVIVNSLIVVKGKNLRKEARSDSNGEYEIPVLPGSYDVEVSQRGFKTLKRKGIKVDGKGCFYIQRQFNVRKADSRR